METIKATIRTICLDAHAQPGIYMVEVLVSEEDAQKITVGKKDIIIKDVKGE